MKTLNTSYVTQFCNVLFELHTTKRSVGDLNEQQQTEYEVLLDNALAQSGLTDSELVLIANCRIHGILRKIRRYTELIMSS